MTSHTTAAGNQMRTINMQKKKKNSNLSIIQCYCHYTGFSTVDTFKTINMSKIYTSIHFFYIINTYVFETLYHAIMQF